MVVVFAMFRTAKTKFTEKKWRERERERVRRKKIQFTKNIYNNGYLNN